FVPPQLRRSRIKRDQQSLLLPAVGPFLITVAIGETCHPDPPPEFVDCWRAFLSSRRRQNPRCSAPRHLRPSSRPPREFRGFSQRGPPPVTASAIPDFANPPRLEGSAIAGLASALGEAQQRRRMLRWVSLGRRGRRVISTALRRRSFFFDTSSG